MELKLHRLRFYTKDEEELIEYRVNGVRVLLPVVYVYEHFGSKEDALKAFMPLGSFAMAETGDSFIAFPLKGAPKLKGFTQLMHRVENGKVSPLDSACRVCKFKMKKVLSVCKPCEGLKGIPQYHPMLVQEIKSKIEVVSHHRDRRSLKTRERALKPVSSFLS